MSSSVAKRRNWLGMAFMVGLGAAGCGTGSEPAAVRADEQGLKEFGVAYRGFFHKHHHPPRSLKELMDNGMGQGAPNALEMLRAGDMIVAWGVPIASGEPEASAVLAYEKSVPERGGSVLLRDARTVKVMTADEFRDAPKAAGL